MTPETEFCACTTCGYKWERGQSGAHSCAERLTELVQRLERDWLLEHRIIELLVAGGFVTQQKVNDARSLLTDMP